MSEKLKVSQNFTNALERLIKGYSYYHSSSDSLYTINGESHISSPPAGNTESFHLTLSADKKTLTIWYSPHHWGAKNRAYVTISRFNINIYQSKYAWVHNGYQYTYISDISFLDKAKGILTTTSAGDIEKKVQQKKSVDIKFTVHQQQNAPDTITTQHKKGLPAKSFEELWGLNNRNILAQTAEFYLLAAASLENKSKYEPVWKEYAREFAELLKNYLAMACGGELRHSRHSNKWLESFRNSDKYETWRAWYDVYSTDPLANAKKTAEEFYRSKAWSGGYGGPSWGKAATYLAEFIEGKYTPAMFVDLVIDLEHNTGCIFNKWFDDTNMLKKLLDAKFRGNDEDYEALLKHVSKKNIKLAYLDTIRSGKRQRLLAKIHGVTNKDIRFKDYKECTNCGGELDEEEKLCKKCTTCPRCNQDVTRIYLGRDLPEVTYHTCPSIRFEIPSINVVKENIAPQLNIVNDERKKLLSVLHQAITIS